MAADDDLIHLCPVEVAVGFGELAEEVRDVTLGALIQVLEVGGELDGGVSAEMRKWSEEDLRCSIHKKRKHLTRGEDGAPEEPSPARLLLAICLEKGREARVFGELEE